MQFISIFERELTKTSKTLREFGIQLKTFVLLIFTFIEYIHILVFMVALRNSSIYNLKYL